MASSTSTIPSARLSRRAFIELDTRKLTRNMKLSNVKTFKEFEELLRNFSNWHGDPVPYDSVGVARLFGAILDNIHKNGIEPDYEAMKDHLTPAQAATLRRIASHLPFMDA